MRQRRSFQLIQKPAQRRQVSRGVQPAFQHGVFVGGSVLPQRLDRSELDGARPAVALKRRQHIIFGLCLVPWQGAGLNSGPDLLQVGAAPDDAATAGHRCFQLLDL